MAAQLVGAQLNYFAGAQPFAATTSNINKAVLLLGKCGGLKRKNQIGDLVLDGSLRTQLHRMRESFKQGEGV